MTATTVAGTSPYPWPWHGRLDPSRTALVLCGWDTGWADRAVDGDPVPRALALAAAAADAGALVVAVSHARTPRLGSGDPLALPPGAVGVLAGGVDGFHASALDDLLRREGRDDLLLAGRGLEGPVHSTMRSANDRGLECLLVVDACTPLTPDAAAGAAHSVELSGGIFGAIGSTHDVLDALRRATTAPTTEEPR